MQKLECFELENFFCNDEITKIETHQHTKLTKWHVTASA